MTAEVGAGPGRPGRRTLRARLRAAFSPIGWATFLVMVGTGVVRVVTPAAPSTVGGLAPVAPSVVLLGVVAGALGGLVAVAVAHAWDTWLGDPRRLWTRGWQVVAAMLAGTVVHGRLLEALGLGVGLLDTFPLVTLAASAFAFAAWWVADGLARDWRAAATARDRLERALAETSGLNDLLAAAERERFDLQARSIALRLEEPLHRLAAAVPSLSRQELATELERLVDEVMRPLAHLMHPVAVRTGLVPAVRALGSTYRLSVPPDLAEADAAGTVLADDVRLQVYRWIRHLEPAVSGGVIELALRRVDGDPRGGLVVEVRGAREGSLAVDPIGRVAGLRCDGQRLRAPLRDADTGIAEEEPAGGTPPRRHLPSLRLLATPPAMNVPFVALISAITTPVRFYPAPVTLDPVTVGALVLSALPPVGVALLLRRSPVPARPAARAAWAVCAWVLVGLAAGLASAAAGGLVAAGAGSAAFGSQVIRGLVRFVPTGLVYQLARGAAAQAQADGAALEEALADARARRARLLARAAAIERFASEALHRTAQGRLTAAAALARTGRDAEALRELVHVREVTLPAILGRLSSVDLEMDELDGPAGAGIVRDDAVDWAELGATHPALASGLRRVIDECVVNAQRHGGARRVEIGLAEEDGRLRLECRDDGAGPGGDAARTPGLGSRLFDEMCARFGGSWTLGPRADGRPGAAFTLVLPVGRSAARDGVGGTAAD